MNLALSALLIILFLLPAFFFRIGIFLPMKRKNEDAQIIHDIISRNVSRALSKLNFTETVFLFSIIPLVLHSVSLLVMSFTGANVNYSLLLNIFAGKQNVLADGSNSVFQRELLSFLLYTLIETVFACVLGWVLFKCLGGKKWLLKTLMGNNAWFRLFTGVALEQHQRGLVVVEALVETKEATVIYSGLLKSYELADNSSELAYISLKGAYRRDLRKAQQVSKELEESKIISSSSFHTEYGEII
ncbi:MAG TPA: hypothetical protein VIM64_11025, partial [Puia sp.]